MASNIERISIQVQLVAERRAANKRTIIDHLGRLFSLSRKAGHGQKLPEKAIESTSNQSKKHKYGEQQALEEEAMAIRAPIQCSYPLL
jgi:hypothetical protein